MLGYTRYKSLASDKHSSLLGPFIIYLENEVLWIRAVEPTRVEPTAHSSTIVESIIVQALVLFSFLQLPKSFWRK
jgi:hypothetical protein